MVSTNTKSSILLANKLRRSDSAGVDSITSTSPPSLRRGETGSTMTESFDRSFEAPRTPLKSSREADEFDEDLWVPPPQEEEEPDLKTDFTRQHNEVAVGKPKMVKRSNTVLSLGDEPPAWLSVAPSKLALTMLADDSGEMPPSPPSRPTPSVGSTPPRAKTRKQSPAVSSTRDDDSTFDSFESRATSPPRQIPRASKAQPKLSARSTQPKSAGTAAQKDDDSIFDSFESRDSRTSSPRQKLRPGMRSRQGTDESKDSRTSSARRGNSRGERPASRSKAEGDSNSVSTSSQPRDDDSIFASFESGPTPTTVHKERRIAKESTDDIFASFESCPTPTTVYSAPPKLRRSATEGSASFEASAQKNSLSSLPATREEDEGDDKGLTGKANKKQSISKRLSVMMGRSSSKSRAPIALDDATDSARPVIIFDWDDTLVPTSYIKGIVIPGLPASDQEGPLPRESPLFGKFQQHTVVVEEMLRAASKVARVAIVTLATNWWVNSSADRYLPGLDFAALCSELDLVVYPADRQSPMVKAYALSGRDPSTMAKKAAMSKCLNKMYCGQGNSVTWNVVSVGDSAIERTALKELCSESNKKQSTSIRKDDRIQYICKTVKLREELVVGELTKELQALMPNLKTLVSHSDDFDRTVATLNPSSASSLGRLLRI